jgi:hypothetical protein
MFHGDEFMLSFPCFLKSFVKTIFEFAGQHQVSSIVHSSGCWCCCARPVT